MEYGNDVMKDKEKDSQIIEQPDVFQITPIESPSKNYLVIDNLQRMPNIFSRGVLYLIVLALGSVLIYSLLGEIDIVSECRAVARSTPHQIGVLSDRGGYIEKVSVSEGQVVEKDDPLFHIRSKEVPTYLSKIENLRHSIPLKKKYYDILISSGLEELNQLYTSYNNSLRDSKSKLTQDITIEEKKFIEREIERAGKEYRSKKVMLESEMKNLRIEMEVTINAMQNELEKSEQMFSLQDKESEKENEEVISIVRARHAGTVAKIYFKNAGEYIPESDLLCIIIQTQRQLYMDIIVANKDIGFIERDMEIKYKFDAFPYTDYGVLLGRVSAISPSAIDDKTLGLVYHIQGTLTMTDFEIGEKKYLIKTGMTATAELVRGKKSIFSILFKKLKR
jgi:multidrug efflux pump subunit AcrA (membrane-fusion protein)